MLLPPETPRLEAHRFIMSGFYQPKPRDTPPKGFAGGRENK